ncbi:MBL fold metallo-hydrolase [Aristophania vespae]|uniref:MBL fold metallo-hydrolase n=1 Tax=Aristophania vespae TaxID=2697033 RepID=UPI002351434D|nr:MBL fold metallo-hydrolase [Aristophania vespae]UMM64119.1 Hydroxyacylglutathione hydrolase GloC [Aristophania vespae]
MTLQVCVVPVTPLRQNCTILMSDTGEAVVVDPGGESSKILEKLESFDVQAILITHGHLDHAGGAAALKQALTAKQKKNVPVWGPGKEDAFLLASIEVQAAAYGIPDLKSIVPDRYLEDGEKLNLLGHIIEVARVPGHTPGHIVFIDREDQRAIVGDTLFRGTVGRTDFAYGNTQQLLSSIRQKILSLPENTLVLSGHGLPTTVGEEKQSNRFFFSGLSY